MLPHHTPSIPHIFSHVFIPAPLSLPTYPLPWHRLALKPSPVDYESTKTTRTRQYRYSRRGCYLSEHSSGLGENLSLCLNAITLPTGIMPTRHHNHTNTITTIATITTTREKTADLISTVVALIALLLSGLQLTQRLLATGCTIRKYHRIISENLTKGGKRHGHWLQLRFTVSYESLTLCLPLEL